MKTLWVFLVAFAFVGGTAAGQDECRLRSGLFERRAALISGGDGAAQFSDKTAASAELQKINEQYFRFLMQVSGEGHQDESESTCCREADEDPVARIVCRFVRYLRTGKKDHRLLLESVPTDSTGREALWALEPLAYLHAEREPQNVPSLFNPSGPVTLYIDLLFALVRSGDREATSKYLELYLYSDSEHAEEMDDQIESLLHKRLGLVLAEWDIFRRRRPAMEKFIAFLSSDERKLLKSEIAANKVCTLNSESCHDLQKLLSVETPLRQ
jgi:hypothetical protein